MGNVAGADRFHLRPWPSQLAMKVLRDKIRAATDRRQVGRPVSAVVADLNPVLRGWTAYFRNGTPPGIIHDRQLRPRAARDLRQSQARHPRQMVGQAPRRRLVELVTAEDCWRLSDPAGTGSTLACSFHRAGRSHAVVVSVDDLDCGAATDILLLEADQLPQALEMLRSQARADGVEVTQQPLDPPELRWQIENALDARAVHYRDDGERDIDELPVDEDGMPGYPAMAALLRARMRTLPTPNKAPAAHADQDDRDYRDGLTARELPALPARGGSAGFGPAPIRSRSLPTARALPPKRAKSDQPAPIYQLKVGLRGATPPIWRRLEAPADISLARLHRIIQVAFAWDDSHLHVFHTPYGEFGIADAELGHRAEAPVTLEQVARTVGSAIRYTYDFGDDWEHEVVVEKVLHRDNTVSYPRCTGGRRAAPPEDCGGIWGYTDLAHTLTDPTHPGHEDMLEWLGLNDAADSRPRRVRRPNGDPSTV